MASGIIDWFKNFFQDTHYRGAGAPSSSRYSNPSHDGGIDFVKRNHSILITLFSMLISHYFVVNYFRDIMFFNKLCVIIKFPMLARDLMQPRVTQLKGVKLG